MKHLQNIIGRFHQLRQLNNIKISGASTLIYAMMGLMMLALCFGLSSRYMKTRDSAQGVENAIATSILGASRVNLAEYGASRNIVVHENLPDRYYDNLDKLYDGVTTEIYVPNSNEYFRDNPAYADEFSVSSVKKDLYLEWSRSKFTELLKQNLELDDNMVPLEHSQNGLILKPTRYDEITGGDIANTVEIEEYTVINRYTYREDTAPYTKHTYTVTYRSVNGGDLMIVPTLSGRDKTIRISSDEPDWSGVVAGGKCDGITVESTSVYVRISFYTNLGVDYAHNKYSQKQTVDRVVTVKND